MSMLVFWLVSSAAFSLGYTIGAYVQWRSVVHRYHLKPKFWTLPRRAD